MRQRRLVSALAIPLVFAFAAASCGGSDDSSSDDTAAPDDTEATTDDTTDDATDDTVEDDGATDTTVAADDGTDSSVVEETEAGVYGGTVTYGLEAESTGFRPWEDACGEPCVNMQRTVFDVLIQQNSEGEYEGYLAESVEPNEDFTVWTLTLRPDVEFSNGVPLTAQTLVDMFAVQQTGSTSAGTIATNGLVSVEATDELTAVYTLDTPNSAFPSALNTVTLGYVFEPAAALADPVGFSSAPVGTGPFTVASRDIDNATVVERNDNYWRTAANGDQLPYLDAVEFRPIPDEGTRIDALISGTIDMMETRRQGTIRDTRAEAENRELGMYEFQGNNTGGGMYNTQIPPFDDVRVRLGLNKLNDQERVIEALGGTGISEPVTQWFSKDSPWWTQAAADNYPVFNYEEGTALIQEYIDDPARSDGKAPGEKIDVELSCPPDPTLIAAMQVLEQVWSGSELVNVTLTQFDQATHINNAVSDDHHAHCWRWGTEADPSAAINPFLTDPELSVSNFPNLYDPAIYALAEQAIQTDDFEERKALYSEIMVWINEQASVWYSGGTATLIATDPAIHGVNNWTLPSGNLGNGTPGALTFFTETFISE